MAPSHAGFTKSDLEQAARVTLVVALGEINESVTAWIDQSSRENSVKILRVDALDDREAIPASWEVLRVDTIGSTEAIRREYLDFLGTVPDKKIFDGKSLNDLFQRRDGFSLWWTEAGVRRSVTHGVSVLVKYIWLIQRAMDLFRPSQVIIHCTESRVAKVLADSVKSAPNVRMTPGTAVPQSQELWRGWAWLKNAIAWARGFVLHRILRTARIRGKHPLPSTSIQQPVVVMSACFPRLVVTPNQPRKVWYWDALANQIEKLSPTAAFRYLLDFDESDINPIRFEFKGILKDAATIRAIPGAIPQWRGQMGAMSIARILYHHLTMIVRFYRVSKNPSYPSIYEYRGVSLAPELHAHFSFSVVTAIHWEYEVETIADILRNLGDVKVVLVHQEFETRGMMVIAACRRLGIPTIGVQHGIICPLHTLYTPTAKQLAASPAPDYYAVYGQYSKEIVSEYGDFPADRVNICAGSRFDSLINEPTDRLKCREKLGLPTDKFIIVITTQPFSWLQKAIRGLLAIAPPNLLVCIKTYYLEGKDHEYQKLIDESPRPDTLLFNDHYSDLLGACDSLMSVCSTTLLEATLVGRPTICLNFTTEPDIYPYVEEGVSISVRSTAELAPALAHLMNSQMNREWQERRRRFLERHLGPAVEGKAAVSFAAWVNGFLGGAREVQRQTHEQDMN